jgi:hypothetical protein
VDNELLIGLHKVNANKTELDVRHLYLPEKVIK